MRFSRKIRRFSHWAIALVVAVPPLVAGENAPWSMERLEKAPDFQWLSQDVPVRPLLYTGEQYRGQPTQVFAYYASPETLGKPRVDGERYPAVVLIHGGGGTAYKVWVELWARRGYAAIAMDLAGCRPDEKDETARTRLPEGGPSQEHVDKFDPIATEELHDDWTWHAVSNSILAHSLIRSFKEVDAEKTAVTGISWGGYTTCIVASFDSRFKAAVPVYGCGFLNENSRWLDEFAKLGEEKASRWVRLYDPSSWMDRCRVPIFFINGTNDAAYPLDSYMKTFDRVPSSKNIRIEVNMPHGHGHAGWGAREIGVFVDHALGLPGAPALATCGAPRLVDGEVHAAIESEVPIESARLVYSKPGQQINQREWVTVEAKLGKGQITAPAPPADADMFFIQIVDKNKSMVSSPVAFVKPD